MTQQIHKVGDASNPSWLVENPDSVDNEVLSFFLEYWRSGRKGMPLPLRESFVPREVRGHLQWVVMADAVPQTTEFRYRLVGSRASEYFLGDGTGKTIREAFAGVDESFVAGVEWIYRRVCEARFPIRMSGPSSRWASVYFPSYDALYLPYSSDGEQADRVLNIFWYSRTQMQARVMPGQRASA